MAITKEQIIEAAEKLAQDGINPSMQAVRDKLGGGSFATISPVLREWKIQKAAVTVAILDMPLDVKAALERFGAELWKAASALANAQLEKLREESGSAIEAANRERDEALDEIERLEALLVQSDGQIASLREEIKSLQSQVESEQKRNAALQQRNDDLSETILALKADLKESRDDGRKALDKLDRLRQEQADLARTNGQLTAQVESLDKELAATVASRNELKAENARLLSLNSQYLDQIESLKSQLGQVQKASGNNLELRNKGSQTRSKPEKK